MRAFHALRPDSGGAAVAPTAAGANWGLEAIASKPAPGPPGTFGGGGTGSTAIPTRIARDTAIGTGARTAIASSKKGYSSAAGSEIFISSTYATTQPAIETGSLWGTAWNGNGDVVQWVAMDQDDEFLILGAESIECR